MLKLSKLVSFGGYSRLYSSGRPVTKIIGLKEKPDLNEIKDDWIGKIENFEIQVKNYVNFNFLVLF